jgi:hypothetical protein
MRSALDYYWVLPRASGAGTAILHRCWYALSSTAPAGKDPGLGFLTLAHATLTVLSCAVQVVTMPPRNPTFLQSEYRSPASRLSAVAP